MPEFLVNIGGGDRAYKNYVFLSFRQNINEKSVIFFNQSRVSAMIFLLFIRSFVDNPRQIVNS
ncbi:hypothetical protein FDUTEX481_02488 [Tolypothrix sp. PCC 7601]|nr:hypothetical protein FDUTEX481_02488 [Tolypothrix sp. PCC 7601]